MSWRPSASIETLKFRAGLINKIREFFTSRGYLEVETPIMGRFGVTDVNLSNIKASFRGQTYYLQTSPEYHMKRLLASCSGPIFQLGKVFRDDEIGTWHNPEFSLLEWYQLGVDHLTLLDEVESLLKLVLNCPSFVKMTYQEAFQEICGFNPLTVSLSEIRLVVKNYGLEQVFGEEEADIDSYLYLLMSHIVEPHFAQWDCPVALIDFPPSQASLAKIKNGVAERFEVYFKGVELANGFHELTEAKLQQARFEKDNEQRQIKELEAMAADEYFLQALDYGLPSCSGVALGVDRLIAIALNTNKLASILSFDFLRA